MSGHNYVYYTLDRDDMERQANGIMELIEEQAFKDGLISDPEALSKRYTVVLASPNVFSRWFNRFFMQDVEKGKAVFKVLKNPEPDEDEDSTDEGSKE